MSNKCQDTNFFQLDHGTASSSVSNPSINNFYRVSTRVPTDDTIDAGSALSKARSILFFSKGNGFLSEFPLEKFRLAQVLNFYLLMVEFDHNQLSSLVNLRHLHVELWAENSISIPSSISNLWNIGSLVLLTTLEYQIHLPKSFWRMKSRRYVRVDQCVLKFLDGHEHEAYPKLDKLVSFSKPILSTGKDVQQLLQRLPAVRKLSCTLKDSVDYDEESVETLDFDGKLETLTLTLISERRERSPCLINFPSTLKKLTLEWFHLPWTTISAIAELHSLEVLKLRGIFFQEQRLEMEDLTFQNLKCFELLVEDLVEWNASIESLPCLEQLVIQCPNLEELPPCFEEISTLKRIAISCSPEVESPALRIQEEQMEQGNKVEVSIEE